MTFTEDDRAIAQPIIDRQASKVARDWPGIEADDIAQEMLIEVMRTWETISDKPEDERAKLITYRANRRGVAYAAQEKYDYQVASAEWIYTPAEIRQLLPEYFTGDMWLAAPTRPNRNETLSGDGASILAMDIRAGYEQLAEQDQVIIMRAYQSGERLYATDRKRLQHAIDRLTAFLNRGVIQTFNHTDHDGPGSRTAMSNAQARVATANTYERG